MAINGVNFINDFYAIERNLDGLSADEKHKQRQKQLKLALDVIFTWLETVNTSSRTKLNKAVGYALNEKKYLYRFLESPYVSIDNNRAENVIRPVCCWKKKLAVFQYTEWRTGKWSATLLRSLLVLIGSQCLGLFFQNADVG